MPTYCRVQVEYGATTTTEGQARKQPCACTKVCLACTPIFVGGKTEYILMSGPPRSKEEKKLERLRREAERKK